MNITAKTRRTLLTVCYIGVFAISVYALFFFLRHKIYLIGSDTFYYMSIADSILQSGSVLNITSIPARPVGSSQNGIVLLHIVLSVLGLGPESRLVYIVLINYLLHLSATYPLYRIAKRVGLAGGFPMAALLGVHVGAWHIYRLLLLPNNDGVFNALSVWLTYFILVALQDWPERKVPELSPRFGGWPLMFALMIALSATLVHFRLHSLCVLVAAPIAAIAARRYRLAIWTTGLLLVSIASLFLTYAFVVDSSRVYAEATAPARWDLAPRAMSAIVALGTKGVPNLLFADTGRRASLIYMVFALALAVALISGLRKREAGLLLVSLLCTVTFLCAIVTAYTIDRYLVYIFAFMYLLILLPDWMRSIGYMFVILVLVSSLGTFFLVGFPRGPASRFWLYLHEQRVELPSNDPLLVSEYSRHPYFFLDTPTFQGELTWDLINSHNGLFLLGSSNFVSARLTEIESMAETANSTFKRQNLTPGYQDEEGHVLLQVYDFTQEEHRQP